MANVTNVAMRNSGDMLARCNLLLSFSIFPRTILPAKRSIHDLLTRKHPLNFRDPLSWPHFLWSQPRAANTILSAESGEAVNR